MTALESLRTAKPTARKMGAVVARAVSREPGPGRLYLLDLALKMLWLRVRIEWLLLVSGLAGSAQ
jgi:hypothetical protein